ncbi:uncharacterized protein LOC101851754 [Aplysia californica]|uniref:Uncharacterized protein LOC101851754 n=1 Tax=Aplysia californica TaxID=6500 RepID=A0ABM1A5E0_APLCA|nr:uncharacterized protein LOC101851754 [Aplysia californica]XP_012941154.1 uncharacterized protein LOC101851754 [Aplysia californica]
MFVFAAVTILALSNACQGYNLVSSLRSVVSQEVSQVEGRLAKKLETLISLQNAGGSGASCSAASGWGRPFNVFGKGDNYYLAFRGTAGVGSSVYEAYIGDYSKKPMRNIEPCCTQVNGSLPCSGHYRNAGILNNWQNIEEVVVALYERGVLKQSLTFDAAGTDYLSWFSPANLKDAGKWQDLKEKTTNFFSIAGDTLWKRRFFINHLYLGCLADNGWFLAMDNPLPPCQYEKYSSFPQFLYSSGTGRMTWSSSGEVAQADVMAIFVKPYNGCRSK